MCSTRRTQAGLILKYFVTGATSGIGLGVVQELARAGHHVVASGRRPATELPGEFPDIEYVQLDLATKASVHETVGASIDRLDRAVLCAGTGLYRTIDDESLEEIERVTTVNFSAAVDICRAVYHPLAARRGRLAIIGSVARRGSAAMPVYSATKAALRGLSRSLQSEWAGRVQVCHLDPWPTRTPMHERAGLDRVSAPFLLMSPDDVARAILRRVERHGRGVHAITPGTIVAMRLGRLCGLVS